MARNSGWTRAEAEAEPELHFGRGPAPGTVMYSRDFSGSRGAASYADCHIRGIVNYSKYPFPNVAQTLKHRVRGACQTCQWVCTPACRVRKLVQAFTPDLLMFHTLDSTHSYSCHADHTPMSSHTLLSVLHFFKSGDIAVSRAVYLVRSAGGDGNRT